MSVIVTTSHAAPFIRYHLIQQCGQAAATSVLRDKRAHFAAAHAYGQSLEIIKDAASTDEPNGVADFDSIPAYYVQAAKEFLKERWQTLGFEES